MDRHQPVLLVALSSSMATALPHCRGKREKTNSRKKREERGKRSGKDPSHLPARAAFLSGTDHRAGTRLLPSSQPNRWAPPYPPQFPSPLLLLTSLSCLNSPGTRPSPLLSAPAPSSHSPLTSPFLFSLPCLDFLLSSTNLNAITLKTTGQSPSSFDIERASLFRQSQPHLMAMMNSPRCLVWNIKISVILALVAIVCNLLNIDLTWLVNS